VEAAHRSYLRRGWQEHLRQREVLERSGFLYDRSAADVEEGLVAVPDLWRPEIERALKEGGPAPEVEEDRASLAVPITLRGQTLGVIGVEGPAGERQWTEEDMALIEAVSEQLGQTLETARLFADTQRRAERERLIGEITAKIRASTDMRDILETTAVELGQVLGTSRALVRVGPGEDVRAPARDALPSTDDENSIQDAKE
jgi:GAF domain-containing protein